MQVGQFLKQDFQLNPSNFIVFLTMYCGNITIPYCMCKSHITFQNVLIHVIFFHTDIMRIITAYVKYNSLVKTYITQLHVVTAVFSFAYAIIIFYFATNVTLTN